ncbi:MAG: 16S rRNA (uracil(1498)-N(3))-methyltransferase [Candidatus Yanofskybacteria bacterium]|nr:16S rRNA (uracil(1498)-N(3))-methyltransferase [Candidatus Yanofskybacteria bacterium]
MKKIHRFIGAWPLALGTLRIDDETLAHQLRSVLKLEPGEQIVLGDGTGTEVQGRILRYDRDAVIVEGIAIGRNANELPGRTILYCAVLKADHFELAAQKATEVGVSEIVPIVTARTVKLSLRLDRVEKIIREAAEQAGRGLVPMVREAVAFERVLTEASRNDVNFFFDPSGEPFGGVAKSVGHAGIWIGPEGGWDEDELERAGQLGMHVASLGNLVLRAETAVIVAAYLVAHSMKS